MKRWKKNRWSKKKIAIIPNNNNYGMIEIMKTNRTSSNNLYLEFSQLAFIEVWTEIVRSSQLFLTWCGIQTSLIAV